MPTKQKRAYVYLLRCADDTFYIGTAKEPVARVAMHNAKRGAKYTRPRLPVVLIYQEGPMSLTKALRREHQLKQLTRAQKEALVAGTLLVAHRRPSRVRARTKARVNRESGTIRTRIRTHAPARARTQAAAGPREPLPTL